MWDGLRSAVRGEPHVQVAGAGVEDYGLSLGRACLVLDGPVITNTHTHSGRNTGYVFAGDEGYVCRPVLGAHLAPALPGEPFSLSSAALQLFTFASRDSSALYSIRMRRNPHATSQKTVMSKLMDMLDHYFIFCLILSRIGWRLVTSGILISSTTRECGYVICGFIRRSERAVFWHLTGDIRCLLGGGRIERTVDGGAGLLSLFLGWEAW